MKTFRPSIYDSDYQLLISWLVDKRKAKGLTQRQLAEELQVIYSLVGKVEKGERRLDVIEFAKYCRALDSTPSEFFKLLENTDK
jgi:transcriptional regulator with XRE-family HTH domain